MNGWLNLLKPTGITSHDCVYWARKKLHLEKTGHTGTLDPNAAGVLCLCIGRATKFSTWVMQKDKTYITQLTLGVSTDTLDNDGAVVAQKAPGYHCADEILDALKQFTGKIWQIPPAYSAIKIGGATMYKLARKGEKIPDIPKREVEIYNLELVEYAFPHIRLRVRCSSGTYIRSLVYDIARTLGEEGHMSMLIREKSGEMDLKGSYSMEVLESAEKEGRLMEYLLPIDAMLQSFPRISIHENAEKFYTNGGIIDAKRFSFEDDNIELGRVYTKRNAFLGLGQIRWTDGERTLKNRCLL